MTVSMNTKPFQESWQILTTKWLYVEYSTFEMLQAQTINTKK